jgi:hypothetical protein
MNHTRRRIAIDAKGANDAQADEGCECFHTALDGKALFEHQSNKPIGNKISMELS